MNSKEISSNQRVKTVSDQSMSQFTELPVCESLPLKGESLQPSLSSVPATSSGFHAVVSELHDVNHIASSSESQMTLPSSIIQVSTPLTSVVTATFSNMLSVGFSYDSFSCKPMYQDFRTPIHLSSLLLLLFLVLLWCS